MDNALIQELKTWQSNFDSRFTKLSDQIAAVQIQADAIDAKGQKVAFGGSEGLERILAESGGIKNLLDNKQGRARIELTGKALNDLLSVKTVTASGLGTSTPGVVQYEMDRGIVPMARIVPRMRDVIPSRPTTLPRIAWLKETVRPTKASPVAEANEKPEVGITVAADYEDVKKIAILTVASDEILSDSTELAGFLRTELANRVREEEDLQILSGSGTGNDLNGLITQAQTWDISILTASDGYEYLDILEGAAAQIAGDNEFEADFCVIHSLDWHKIRRTKDSTGRYIFGAPNAGLPPQIWNMRVIPSNQIAQGSFLVGSSSPRAAELRDRMALTIDISTEDSTNFKYNLVTIRAELRTALVVKRPDAFVQGSLTQSPA